MYARVIAAMKTSSSALAIKPVQRKPTPAISSSAQQPVQTTAEFAPAIRHAQSGRML